MTRPTTSPPWTPVIAAIPRAYRRKVLVRLDGAGFSHKLLEHIAAGGGVKGRRWEFSVGWACTDRGDRRHRPHPQARVAAWDRPGRQPRQGRLGPRHHRAAGPIGV